MVHLGLLDAQTPNGSKASAFFQRPHNRSHKLSPAFHNARIFSGQRSKYEKLSELGPKNRAFSIKRQQRGEMSRTGSEPFH